MGAGNKTYMGRNKSNERTRVISQAEGRASLHVLWDSVWLLKGGSVSGIKFPGDPNKKVNMTTYKSHTFLKTSCLLEALKSEINVSIGPYKDDIE